MWGSSQKLARLHRNSCANKRILYLASQHSHIKIKKSSHAIVTKIMSSYDFTRSSLNSRKNSLILPGQSTNSLSSTQKVCLNHSHRKQKVTEYTLSQKPHRTSNHLHMTQNRQTPHKNRNTWVALQARTLQQAHRALVKHEDKETHPRKQGKSWSPQILAVGNYNTSPSRTHPRWSWMSVAFYLPSSSKTSEHVANSRNIFTW